ncbi:hypothetical protein [Marinivivus vitaminiproducens]|uniref:hypothetical protein n=1 Tax=Marinivivus vitaminiproducens TaxID=3035935 RepID=UPI00279B6D33|nr:hypothetical protein P4R82_13175 [Geminicoccaceae bacterium SCSIO 64248]
MTAETGPASAYETLRERVAAEAGTPVPAAVHALAGEVRGRHGGTVQGVLFYGSCLRQGEAIDLDGSVLDLYVLVGRYRDAYPGRLLALANRVLPPNVFFVEVPWQGQVIRAKYAVLALDQLERWTKREARIPTFWARFAQPVRLVWAADDQARARVLTVLADAFVTFAFKTAALVDPPVEPDAFWTAGLTATYRAELRSEGPDRARLLAEREPERTRALTPLGLAASGIGEPRDDGRLGWRMDPAERARSLRAWRFMWASGKALSVLRLAKALFTFQGGVDYALYKIERHTGRRPELRSFERRHPILCAPVILWRLRRSGSVR